MNPEAPNPPRAKLPRWLTVQDWLNATIDLSDYNLGVVKLRDATGEAVDEYDRCFNACNGRLLLKPQAALLRAYVLDGSACAMPSRGSDLAKWERWVEKQNAKPITRLVRGILLFRTVMADLDQDAAGEQAQATGEAGTAPVEAESGNPIA